MMADIILLLIITGSILTGYLAAVSRKHIAAGDIKRVYIILLTFSDYLTNSDSHELRDVKRK